jgi:hypothetical protein
MRVRSAHPFLMTNSHSHPQAATEPQTSHTDTPLWVDGHGPHDSGHAGAETRVLGIGSFFLRPLSSSVACRPCSLFQTLIASANKVHSYPHSGGASRSRHRDQTMKRLATGMTCFLQTCFFHLWPPPCCVTLILPPNKALCAPSRAAWTRLLSAHPCQKCPVPCVPVGWRPCAVPLPPRSLPPSFHSSTCAPQGPP